MDAATVKPRRLKEGDRQRWAVRSIADRCPNDTI